MYTVYIYIYIYPEVYRLSDAQCAVSEYVGWPSFTPGR